ncbi:MAG: glycolate oxidase subunit GlcF [Gammaproteobacteria bacterium]|nr:glycolate oxidase subunit GlcF [Gammaproteobacteria bacterium]
MLTELRDDIRDTPTGRTADRILRNCVHCGFCLATCPTYRLLGDELDSPRGRIYLIKSVLEGKPVSGETRLHLDRCLTCRACETTCPSGVEYGRLLEIGREAVEAETRRPWHERWQRRLLLQVLPYRRRFTPLLKAGQWLRPLLPSMLKRQIPPRQKVSALPAGDYERNVILFQGCVQPALAPGINSAAGKVLQRAGVGCREIGEEGCCGALSLHLGNNDGARRFARHNVDAWWPAIEAGAEAIVVTASGCGVMIKDYPTLLADDPEYHEKAVRISELARDPAEYLSAMDPSRLPVARGRVAFQSPCTLQHGQKLGGVTEALLETIGFELTPVPDSHQCCGSAGTYSILQPRLAAAVRDRKLAALHQGSPERILTANIGCLLHLQQATATPVSHWLEAVAATDGY